MAVLGKQEVATVHPKYWPYCDTSNAELYVWTATTDSPANGSTFWTYVSDTTFGAAETTTSKSADTYYTYVDITGSHGVMGTIILPHCASTASGFYTIKLTTDGVVEEFKTLTTSMSNSRRRWLGFCKEYANSTDVRYQNEGGFGLYRFHDEDSGIDSYSGNASLRSAQDMVVQGLPVHTFETSLKLEVKCSIAGKATAHEATGGVVIYSFPN